MATFENDTTFLGIEENVGDSTHKIKSDTNILNK